MGASRSLGFFRMRSHVRETRYAEAGAANGVRETPTSKPLALDFPQSVPSWGPAPPQCLPSGFRSPGLTDLVGSEGILDVGQDALLGGAGQLAHALEYMTGFSNRARAALGSGLLAEQLVGCGAQHTSKIGEIIRAQGRGASFPSGVSLLRNAELVRDLSLRESGELADGH
jgi:hypothetical protein